MADKVLMTMIAGERAAIRASAIDTVTRLGSITPVPRAPAHVSGVSTLRSRALFVIDCTASLTRRPARHPLGGFGVVVMQEGHAYALAVEEVYHLAEIKEGPEPASIDLHGAWQELSEGQVVTTEGTMMLLDPQRLIEGAEQAKELA